MCPEGRAVESPTWPRSSGGSGRPWKRGGILRTRLVSHRHLWGFLVRHWSWGQNGHAGRPELRLQGTQRHQRAHELPGKFRGKCCSENFLQQPHGVDQLVPRSRNILGIGVVGQGRLLEAESIWSPHSWAVSLGTCLQMGLMCPLPQNTQDACLKHHDRTPTLLWDLGPVWKGRAPGQLEMSWP